MDTGVTYFSHQSNNDIPGGNVVDWSTLRISRSVENDIMLVRTTNTALAELTIRSCVPLRDVNAISAMPTIPDTYHYPGVALVFVVFGSAGFHWPEPSKCLRYLFVAKYVLAISTYR